VFPSLATKEASLVYVHLFFALLILHALFDFPLQGDYLARGKNRFNPIPDTPWYWCMAAHAGLHAGAVWVMTGQPWLGVAEFVAHWFIDDLKCSGRLGLKSEDCCDVDQHPYDIDQFLHIFCKFLWVSSIAIIQQF
jgi:hypothetical protein